VTPGLPEDQTTLPANIKGNIQKWQTMHPHSAIALWDNQAIRKSFPELLPVLEQIHTMSWISNLVRYHVLERYGGIYLDTDIVPLHSLWQLRQARFGPVFSVCENPNNLKVRHSLDGYIVDDCELVNNAVIGGMAHHPVFQAAIKMAMRNTLRELETNPGGQYKLKTSGPPVWTKAVREHEHDDVKVLHPSLFFPCSWENKQDCQVSRFQNVPHIYGMHQWTMSWLQSTTPASGTMSDSPSS
jgi:hypothetical protein